jgi:hypothetical protein
MYVRAHAIIQNYKMVNFYSLTLGRQGRCYTPICSYENFVEHKLKPGLEDVGNAVKNKTEIVINNSMDIALEKAIEMLTATETKLSNSKLNNVEVSVAFALGPVTVSINKRIQTQNE